MEKVITLSDGEPCAVKVLDIFAPDRVALVEQPGPFYYQIDTLDGNGFKMIYTEEDMAEPKPKPGIPKDEATPNSRAWFAWEDYDTHRAAEAHKIRQIEIVEEFNSDLATMIVDECVDPGDVSRVITIEDFRKIQEAALVPEVGKEDIAAALRNTFQGDIRGEGDS